MTTPHTSPDTPYLTLVPELQPPIDPVAQEMSALHQAGDVHAQADAATIMQFARLAGAPGSTLNNTRPAVTVALPALTELYDTLAVTESGSIANKVPLRDNRLQVGYRGAPEGFGAMNVSVDGASLLITADSPRELEGPFVDTSSGKKRVGRAVIGPLASIELKPLPDGQWHVTTKAEDKTRVRIGDNERVVLARTLAKLADVSLGKLGNK